LIQTRCMITAGLLAAAGCGYGDGRSSGEQAPLVATCVDIAPGAPMPEFGCFNIGEARDLHFDEPVVYWHLRTFPDRASAEAARSETGVVVEVEGRVWLTELGPRDLAIGGGEAVAVVGPLELPPAAAYHAVVSYAPMRPGDRSIVHTHSGPEGWYMLAGEQCLETQTGTRRASAGETMTVEASIPMELSITGTELRRSLLVVVHDATQPRGAPSDWKPSGACARA
jgi:quercetin dioxygenase-like cupin family protein